MKGNSCVDSGTVKELVLQSCSVCSVNKDEYCSNIYGYATTIVDSIVVDVHSLEAMNHIRLGYHCTFPVNIMVNDDALIKYNSIFVLLLKVRRAVLILQEIWVHFRHPSVKFNKDPRIRMLQLFHGDMLHFVNVLHEYFASKIAEQCSKLHTAMKNAKSIHEMVSLHDSFLKRLVNMYVVLQ